MIEQPGEAMAEVENVRVAFPDFGHVWNAAPSELELEMAALSIVIGARVKVRATVARAPADAPLHASAHHGALASPQVRATVARPRCSWPDGVDHRSVGSVRRVMPDGVCFVRFAVSPRWLSFDLAELEAASTEDEATAQAAHDDGWASLKAGDRRRVGGLLRAPQHNGQMATIERRNEAGRFVVLLDGGARISVRPENLLPVVGDSPSTEAGAEAGPAARRHLGMLLFTKKGGPGWSRAGTSGSYRARPFRCSRPRAVRPRSRGAPRLFAR